MFCNVGNKRASIATRELPSDQKASWKIPADLPRAALSSCCIGGVSKANGLEIMNRLHVAARGPNAVANALSAARVHENKMSWCTNALCEICVSAICHRWQRRFGRQKRQSMPVF